jgi:hypothetical protein
MFIFTTLFPEEVNCLTCNVNHKVFKNTCERISLPDIKEENGIRLELIARNFFFKHCT